VSFVAKNVFVALAAAVISAGADSRRADSSRRDRINRLWSLRCPRGRRLPALLVSHGTIIIMRVEFFGVPRERAGVAELELRADTLGQLMTALAMRFPSLDELITGDRLRSSFVANLNGDRFVSDPRTELTEHDCVLILSADAGG